MADVPTLFLSPLSTGPIRTTKDEGHEDGLYLFLAETGMDRSSDRAADEWIPACAGMTSLVRVEKLRVLRAFVVISACR
jgi:hypothetical protein